MRAFICVDKIITSSKAPIGYRTWRLWVNVDEIASVDEDFDLHIGRGDMLDPPPERDEVITCGQLVLRSVAANLPGKRIYTEQLADMLVEMIAQVSAIITIDTDGIVHVDFP